MNIYTVTYLSPDGGGAEATSTVEAHSVEMMGTLLIFVRREECGLSFVVAGFTNVTRFTSIPIK